jgi:iron complex outermembrane recepter protein
MQAPRTGPGRLVRSGPECRRPALAGAALAIASLLAMASAGPAGGREPSLLEVVVGSLPLPGTAVAIEELPGEVHALDLSSSARAQHPTDALAARFAAIGLEDPLGDAVQASLSYRGFTASPVLGTPQGLVVYQNGVRLNEAFGDVVNWDLVPAFAVRRLDVVGASPEYGANALGGAVVFTMNNGISDRGLVVDLEAGAFDARTATIAYGARAGELAVYVAARSLDEDGARRYAGNALRQLYADLRYASARRTVALSVSAAHNRLDGPGATPVQELAVSRSLTFTGPQQTDNDLGLAALSAESRLDQTLSLAGVAYYRHVRQALANGNTTSYRPCATAAGRGLLCQPDGTTPLATLDGALLPDPTGGGAVPLGENDAEQLRATTRGGSVQLGKRATVLGHNHALTLGLALDAARVDFAATAQAGAIDPQLQVSPGGAVIGTPQGTAFRATPIDLGVVRRALSWHASDALTVSHRLTVTAGAQYAVDDIELADRRGTALTGTSRYQRLNPALGASYRLDAGPIAYAGYAETTRTPSPSEIECSDSARPCLLPSTLAGDPPRLRQVVARTWELGVRQADAVAGIAGLGFSAGLFRADLADDIYGIATGAGSGYYANIAATRRQGLSLGVAYRGEPWSAFLDAALLEATFRSALSMPSPQNPFADASGAIAVRPGARLPGIARERVTAGVEWRATPTLRVGATVTGVGPSYYHGDESNQNPRLAGYARVDLHAGLLLGERVELTCAVQNLLDAHYASYGLYADPTGVGAPGVPVAGAADAGIDRRFQTPATPFAVRLGLRLRL